MKKENEKGKRKKENEKEKKENDKNNFKYKMTIIEIRIIDK